MARNWRCLVAVALATGALIMSACSSDSTPTPPPGPAVGPTYVYGQVESPLATALIQAFSPVDWNGQTDGPVLISADKLFSLTEDQKTALRVVLQDGHAVLVTDVTQEQLQTAHDLIAAKVPSIDIDTSTGPAMLYVFAYPNGKLRTLAIRDIPRGYDQSQTDEHFNLNAQKVIEWYQAHVRGTYEADTGMNALVTALEGETNYNILGTKDTDFPWMHTQQDTMAVYYSNRCGTITSCSNVAHTNIYSWAVHNPWPLTDQPSDFLIARVTGSLDVSRCAITMGSTDRFAGFWLQEANMSAHVANSGLLSKVSVLDYAPIATNPDITQTKGVTWSFGGSGTIGGSMGFSGAKPTAEVNKSLGFSFGVSYSNETTFQYKALATIPKMGDLNDPTKVMWSYNGAHFVYSNLEPGNHACGGPGFKKDVLPPIMYAGTFTPSQDFIWALKPEVRSSLGVAADGYTYVPVQVDTSLLMGWAFWQPTSGYCDKSGATGAHYNLNNRSADIVGLTYTQPLNTSPNNGALFAGDALNFDWGCGTTTKWGTVPLGDKNKSENTVVGVAYPFKTMSVGLPLAPDPRAMTLTSIEPTSGPQGTVITLRGKALNTATTTNVGGQPPNSQSMEYIGAEAVIKVTAPMRVSTSPINVAISVSNAVVTTDSFNFLYTN